MRGITAQIKQRLFSGWNRKADMEDLQGEMRSVIPVVRKVRERQTLPEPISIFLRLYIGGEGKERLG